MTSNWQTSSFVFSLFADDPCELKQPKWGVILSPFFPQVEFSYPPLMPDEGHDSNLLPEEWKYLPFLALPDGAHNYQEGTAQTHFVIKSYEVLQRSQCYFICRVLTDCLQMEHFSAECFWSLKFCLWARVEFSCSPLVSRYSSFLAQPKDVCYSHWLCECEHE